MAEYGIDSFHIAVGQGDAAIHLLIEVPADPTVKPTVISATLIDGGQEIGRGLKGIQNTMKIIAKKYNLDAKGLRFDSIVITHWDEDHYQGIVELIESDITTQLAGPSPPTLETICISFMKYGDGGRSDPQTVLYAPYWTVSRQNSKSAKFRNQKTSLTRMDFKHGSKWAEKICQLNFGDFRGTNFLTNVALTSTTPEAVTSPEALYDANSPAAGHPAIFCVGTNRLVMGPDTVNVVDKVNSYSNQSSICAMVIWKGGKISSYFAGDANFDVEDKVFRWSGTNGDTKRVFNMKLSHHGAASSTPVEMLDGFNPKSIIVSAATGHQHPRWEVVLYLSAWVQADVGRVGTRPVLSTQYPTYLVQTKSKYTDFGSTTSYSFPDEGYGTDPVIKFLEDLKNLYVKINAGAAKAGKPEINIYETYLTWLKNNPTDLDRVRLEWIYDQVLVAWSKISPITSSSHVATSAAAKGANATPLSGKDLLDYIRVACRNTASEGVFIKYSAEENDEPPPVAPPVIPAPTAAKTDTVENEGEPVKKKIKLADEMLVSSTSFTPPEDVDSDEGDPPVEEREMPGDLPLVRKKEVAIISVQENGFYFYCSQIQATGTNVRILSAGDMDDFVTALRHGVVCLQAEPAANTPALFLDSDEWLCWFTDCVKATSLSATGDENGNMSGFNLSMTSPMSTIQSLPGDPATDILFSTSNVAFAFPPPAGTPGLLDPPGGSIPDPIPGLLGEVDILILGLDPASPVLTMKLSELFAYVGLSTLADLTSLSDTVLVLDPKKSGGNRNAIWFNPSKRYSTVVRLQFELEDLTTIRDYCGFLTDFTIADASVIGKKNSTWTMGPEGVSITSLAEVILTMSCTVKNVGFQATLTFEPDVVTMELTTVSLGALEVILVWLMALVGVEEFDFTTWLANAGQSLDAPQFRRVSLVLTTGAKPAVKSFSMDMEIKLNFGGGGNNPALFLFTYNWSKGQKFGELRAALWCKPPADAVLPYRKFLPTWEDHLVFEPITVAEPSETLDLANLIPDGSGVSNIPTGIPTNICQAYLQIDDTGVTFFGALTCTSPPPTGVPAIYLGKVTLDARYTWGAPNPFDLTLRATTLIQGRADSPVQANAVLYGSVQYESGNWHLDATLQDLYASTLYSFFDTDSRDGVMTFLERLEIKELSLKYNYLKEGGASDFAFDGIILLGKLELDLNFIYNSTGWSFTATLGASGTETSTITEIVESILGPTDDIPPFVGNITVDPNTSGGLVNINCEKIDGALFFSVSVHVGPLEFTFAQFRDAGWAATVEPKRLFKVSVKELPEVDVPLVGNLTQPFDEMFYLWVQDKSGKNGPGKPPGITRDEYATINGQLKDDKLAFKETFDPKQQTAADVVIGAGSHFVLILKGEKGELNVIIDYLFSAPSQAKQLELVAAGADASPPSDSSLAPYKKSIGPLSISNIGFHYKDGILSVLVDASFLLGPVGFTLMGFSLDITFGDTFTIQDFPVPSVSLSGLAVSFDRPPIVISGLYKHVKTPKLEYYAGGVIIAFDPYLFEAAGFYGTTPDPGGFESVFVFAKLDGPLVTLEFAEISGITGGFGYNVELEFPSVSQVYEFPLLTIKPTPGSSPMDTLIQLTAPGVWFNPREGSFWIAAGLKVTAFETLAIDAVVVVEWNPYVKLGLFGIAVADVPAGAAEKFVHVELGISATVDFNVGVMKFEAQLSPNSYVLSPNCHLTGGFALYYWFKGSDPKLEGDWVFTIGGYHQAFTPPSQYPNPPRLGISWNLDDSLSVTGESYFAITPKVCMGGGRLHAALSLGLLYAYFDAYADFLINYKPFHFIADGGVTVGVRFTLDLWIVTIHINLEIGAQLYLIGPPLSGTVHVDFWVFGFDVHFGPGAARVDPVTLEEFYQLVLQSDTQSSLSGANFLLAPAETNFDDDPPAQPFVFGCRSGLMTGSGSQETPPGTPWDVRAGSFSFAISCRFAINSATLNAEPPTILATGIFAKPMQLETALTSSLTVTIVSDTEKTLSDEPLWKIEQLVKSVPNALWGIYNPALDPAVGGNNIPSLLDGGDVATALMMGVIISAPDPVLSNDIIPKFNAAAAMAQDVFALDEPAKIFPNSTTEASANWLPLKAGPDQWADVSKAWANPKRGAASQQNTVNLWTDAFFWEALSGSVPPILLETFDDLYLAAPLLGELSNDV